MGKYKNIDNETLAAIVQGLKEYFGEGIDVKTGDANEMTKYCDLLGFYYGSGEERICVYIYRDITINGEPLDKVRVLYPHGKQGRYDNKVLYEISLKALYIIYSHAPYLFGWDIDYSDIARANKLMALEYLNDKGHVAVIGDRRIDFVTRVKDDYPLADPTRTTKYATEMGFKPIKPNNI